MSAQPIGPHTRLPSARQPVILHTADGCELVGEIAQPIDHPPQATLVTVHPLPTHGGSSDSHLYRKMTDRLPALAELAVLRFNTRGTSSSLGRSEGEFSGGTSERYDVMAAIEYADFAQLPNVWMVGWSFGADMVLAYGCDPMVQGAVLLSPPLKYCPDPSQTQWASSGKSLTVLVPEFDDYLRPARAGQRFAAIPQAEVVGVAGAKHLWVGEPAVRRVLNEITARVAPQAHPLPEVFQTQGP